MPEDSHGRITSPVAIPWWPGKSRLCATLARSRLTLANTEGELVQGTTKYKDWSLKDQTTVRAGYGEYVFGAMLSAPGPSEVTLFLWNPPIPVPEGSEEGAFVQTLVTEEEDTEEYSWPPVLKDLQILLSQVAAGGGDSNLEPVERGPWIDGQRVPSRVVRRVYASTMRPPARYLRCDVPMPTSIRGDYYGKPVRLPPCLHPEVIMESIASDDAVIQDCTPNVTTRGTGNVLVYGATNHQQWVRHIKSNRVENQDGLYMRTEETVYPPRQTPVSYT